VTSARDFTVGFATIADSANFVGAVALVNSLRLHGHDDPITVLDVGLTDAERRELAGQCDVVAAPSGDRHPWLLAPFACLARPAEVVVSLDSDVIVTASLDRILLDAHRGQVCAFSDFLSDRWFAEWEEVFGLPMKPRHQAYVNSGFVAFSTVKYPDLLQQWADRCADVSVTPVATPPIDLTDPLALPDQDILNALLMTVVAPAAISVQPEDSSAQGQANLARARVRDLRTLACSLDGTATTLLHSWGMPKPWQPAARRTLRGTPYVRCLRRLLVGPDLAVRSELPRVPWLTPGPRGALTFRYLIGRTAARRRARRALRRSARRRAPTATGVTRPAGQAEGGEGQGLPFFDARHGGPTDRNVTDATAIPRPVSPRLRP